MFTAEADFIGGRVEILIVNLLITQQELMILMVLNV